ncbi:Hpt domain-containing protein [Fervidobacterium sp.]
MIFREEDIEVLQGIIDESSELLKNAEQKIIELEGTKDENTIKEVFRIFHSIKGLAGFGNITPVVDVAHALENLLKRCRDGEMACSSSLVDLLLDGIDFFKTAFGEIASRLANFNGGEFEIPLEELGHDSIIERAHEFETSEVCNEDKEHDQPDQLEKKQSTDSNFFKESKESEDIISEDLQKELFADFLSELNSNIVEAENGLLKYEENNDVEILRIVMRAMHSIKGGARLILSLIGTTEDSQQSKAIVNIEKVSHALEDILQELLNFKREEFSVDTFFKGIDIIKELGNSLVDENLIVNEESIKNFLSELSSGNVYISEEPTRTSVANLEEARDFDDFSSKEAFLNIATQLVDYAKYLLTDTSADPAELERIAEPLKAGLLMIDHPEKINVVDKIVELGKKKDYDKLGKLLDEFVEWLEGKKADINLESETISSETSKSEKLVSSNVSVDSSKQVSQTVRVNQAKLDSLVNLVGELITLKNSVKYVISEILDYVPQIRSELKNITLRLERLSYEFQSSVMSLRMTPVGELFQRYNRTVRDLSKSLGKKVLLLTEGEDVELERSVLEILSDPMTHLIRNAIDHGIELPEERIRVGKPEQGKITLRAYYRGNSVVVEVEDDGRGIDANKVRMKAVDKGLIPPDKSLEMSDEQIIQLIFEPGFSTAEQVSNLSGRGVGMDVVKTNVEKIGGKVFVRTNPGRGTVTSMVIPQSLMAIKGLLVMVGNERYIIPTDMVRETIKIPKSEVKIYKDMIFSNIRGEIVPLIFAESILNNTNITLFSKEFQFELVPVALIKGDSGTLGIIVDKFVEESDYLVKSVPESLQGGGLITGATIMGDGSVVLILDPTKLL